MDVPIQPSKNWTTKVVPIKPDHLKVPLIANPHFFRPKYAIVIFGSKKYISREHEGYTLWAGLWHFEKVDKFKIIKRCNTPQGFLGRRKGKNGSGH